MSATRQVGGPRLATSEDEWRGREIRDSGDDASQSLRERDKLGSLEQIRSLKLGDRIHGLDDIASATMVPLPESPTNLQSPVESSIASLESLNDEYDSRNPQGFSFEMEVSFGQHTNNPKKVALHASLPRDSRPLERTGSWLRGAYDFPVPGSSSFEGHRELVDTHTTRLKEPFERIERHGKEQRLHIPFAGSDALEPRHMSNSNPPLGTLSLPYFPSAGGTAFNAPDFSSYSYGTDVLPERSRTRGSDTSTRPSKSGRQAAESSTPFAPLPPWHSDELQDSEHPAYQGPSEDWMSPTDPFQLPPPAPPSEHVDENIDNTSDFLRPSTYLPADAHVAAKRSRRVTDAKLEAIPPNPTTTHMIDHYLHGADTIALPPSRSASERYQVSGAGLYPDAPLPPPLSAIPSIIARDLDGANLVPLPQSKVSSLESVPVETHGLSLPAELSSHGHHPERPPHHVAISGQEPGLGSDITDLVRVRPTKASKKKAAAQSRFDPFAQWLSHLSPDNIENPYSTRIQSLARCMPHLRRLENRTIRHQNKGLITRIDYKIHINNPRSNSRKTFGSSIWAAGDVKRFSNAVSRGRKGTPFLRLLIVEDLSPGLMHTLGSQFNIDPELYAHHLTSSGYETLSHSDPPTSRWNTSKMPKSYKSIKWYRPVRIEPRILSWMQGSANIKQLEEVGIDWTDVSYQRREDTFHETKTHHWVALATNIFRRCRPLSTRPADFAGKYVTATWEERASVFLSSKDDRSTLIVVVDPLPMLSDSKAIEEIEFPLRNFLQSSARPKISRVYESDVFPAFAPLAPRTPVNFPVNKMEASDAEIKTLETLTSNASSTAADIESWIWQRKAMGIRKSRDPLIAVLRLAYIDSVDYLDNLGWTLDEIVRDSLDEDIMTRRLTSWRKLLSDLEIEVPALGQTLREFINPDHADYLEAQDMIIDLEQSRIPKLINRVHAVHAALRSEMALLDSKRSIAEAKTMARLTELAFVFIPLTFACSGFSMQIRELEGGVPLWAFIIAAVTLGLITYTVRVILQSEYLGSMRRRLEQRVIASKGHATDQGVSNSDVAIYLAKRALRESGPSATFLLALAFPVLPIAFLWDRNHIDAGLNAMMTLLILPAGLVMAWYARAACIEIVQADGDDESSDGVTKLSMAEKMAMRVARLLARPRDPDSASSSSESV